MTAGKKIKNFENLKKNLRRYGHLNLVLADQAMVSGLNFCIGIFLARNLSVDGFGRFTLIWMTIFFVNSIQMAAISMPMMSIGPKQPSNEVTVYYRAVAFQQLVFSLVSSLTLFVCISLIEALKPEWRLNGYALPVAVMSFTFQNQDFLRRYFFSRGLSINAICNDLLSYAGNIILIFSLFLVKKPSVVDISWVIAFSAAFAICVGLLKIDKNLPNLKELKEITKRHWSFSKWAVLSAFLQWIYGNFIFFITGVVLGTTSVAILRAAQNIVSVLHVLFLGLDNFVPVQASKKYAQFGIASLREYTNKIQVIGSAVTITTGAVIFIFSGQLLGIAYGKAYSDYAHVLRWFSIVYIVLLLGFPLRVALRTIENTKAIFLSEVIASTFVVGFGYIILKNFGLVGALISLLLAYLIIYAFLQFSFSKSVKVLEV